MPFFGDTGTQYDQQTADQLTQALQTDPWRQQAQQRKAAIQARGGQWAPEDYQFFGVDSSRMDQHWKDKYLNNIDQMAAQGIAQKSGQNFNTGIYNIEDGKVGQRKSFVDHWYGKAAVLGPMIAGGGISAMNAMAGAPAVAGAAPEVGAGGEGLTAGLGGAGAVGPGGGLAGTAGTAGGLGAAGDITGELAASTGTASGGVSVPATLGGTSAAGTIGGTSTAGGLSKWLPTLFNTGMQLGGAALGSHAAGKAAEQQAAQVQNALNLQRDLYGQSRQALMPYYQLGAGSLGRLGAFLGTKPAAAIPDGTLGSLGGK